MSEELSENCMDICELVPDNDTEEPALIAENSTVITPELFHDAFMLTYNKASRSQILAIGAVCTILGCICLFIQFYKGTINIFWIPFLCMGIYSLIHGYRLIEKTEQQRYKILLSKKADFPAAETSRRKISFYEDHVDIRTPGGQTLMKSYADITDVREGEKVLVLIMEDKTAVIIEKDGFLSGSSEAVQQTIKEYIS